MIHTRRTEKVYKRFVQLLQHELSEAFDHNEAHYMLDTSVLDEQPSSGPVYGIDQDNVSHALHL